MDVDRTAADGRELGPLHRSCVDRRTQIRAREARPGRRGGGSCSWVIGVVSIYLVTLWCSTTHPPIFSRSALRRAARRLGKFDLDYVTLRNYA